MDGKLYTLSTDYEAIKPLLDAGERIAGWADMFGTREGEKVFRDIVEIKKNSHHGFYRVGYRGAGGDADTWEEFTQYLKKLHVAYIVPESLKKDDEGNQKTVADLPQKRG